MLKKLFFKMLEKSFVKTEKRLKSIKRKLIDCYDGEKIDGKYISIFESNDYYRKSINKKLLKEKYPEVYENVMNEKLVKGNIKIRKK